MERLAAHLAARSGEVDAAAAHWLTARRRTSEAGVGFDAAVLALELAERAPDGDRTAAAQRREAIATFERLRAEPWLERARRGTARPMR
jgi:hypothetical protein